MGLVQGRLPETVKGTKSKSFEGSRLPGGSRHAIVRELVLTNARNDISRGEPRDSM